MGDGYWDNESKTIYICTECFTLKEVHILLNILRNKFKLVATLKKRNKGYRIRFSRRELNLKTLINFISPHFHPSMFSQFGNL